MSTLSPRRPDSTSPPIYAYLLAYGLCLLLFAAGVGLAFLLRDLLQMAMLFTPWDRYVVHVANQASVVLLVVLLVALLVLSEAWLRNGVRRRQLLPRFARILGTLALILAAAQLLRLGLELLAGSLNLFSLLALAAGLLLYSGSRAAQPGKRTSSPHHTTLLVTTVLLAGSTLIALPIKSPLNLYDEGLALVNGLRVHNGDLPLRDYWTIYPPGQSYVLATLFGVAGENVLVARSYDSLVRMALALSIYGMAGFLLHSWRWALLPYLAAATLLAAATFYGYAIFPALLLSLAALAAGRRATQNHQQRWLWIAGSLTGLTALFRLDLGLYAAVALAILLTYHQLLHPPHSLRAWLAPLLTAGSPALGLVLVFYGWLGSNAGFAPMIEQLLLFPATTFRAVRQLPYPALLPDWTAWSLGIEQFLSLLGDSLRFYLPLLLYALVALQLIWAALRRRDTPPTPDTSLAAALTALGAGLFAQALSRYDEIHVLPASLVAVLLTAWLARQIPARRWQQPWLAVPALLLVLIPALLYFAYPYARLTQLVQNYPPQGCYSSLPRAGCVATVPGQDEVVQFLEKQAPGPIYSGLTRHDVVLLNDVSLYFLAGRPTATRYHELHPGVTTTRPVQEEMVAELTRYLPQWLLLVDLAPSREPNASRFSSGVTLLDDYIHRHYQRQQTVGLYQLWRAVP